MNKQFAIQDTATGLFYQGIQGMKGWNTRWANEFETAYLYPSYLDAHSALALAKNWTNTKTWKIVEGAKNEHD